VLGVALVATARSVTAERVHAPPREESPVSPEEVFNRADQFLNERDRLAEGLARIARDESRSARERERAVILLVQLGSEPARKFLLQNLSMRIPLARRITSEQQGRMQPCLYYLHTREYRDWNVAHTLLDLLDDELPKEQLVWLPGVLRNLFSSHPGTAKTMLEYELKQATTQPRKSQVEYLLANIGR
jgi:hypothetical protein